MDSPYLDTIINWAKSQDDIRAVIVTGSLSRNDGSVDEWSDLDVELVCTELTPSRLSADWVADIGEVWICFPADKQSHFRLIWFTGGHKVDFQLQTVAEKQAMITTGKLSDEYKRGYNVALDKDNLYSQMPASPNIFPIPDLPSKHEVHEIINEFWFEAIHVAQFIRRREFWVVKFRDWTMKCDLLQMLEWHARLSNNPSPNTWIIGKRIHQWANKDSFQAIQKIWSGWDAQANWDSLFVMLDLFDKLSSDVAHTLDYDYRRTTYQEIYTYIQTLRTDDRDR